MLNLSTSFTAATAATAAPTGWLQLLHLAYVVSGLVMATAYVGQIRRIWRQPQASLLAQSMPSWLQWTACRSIALAYGICVIGDAAFIWAVGLDVCGRLGVLLALLRARNLHRWAALWSIPARPAAQRGWAGSRRLAVQAVCCLVLMPALSNAAPSPAAEQGSLSQKAAYAQAQQLLKEKRYAEAYGRFAELADQGHRESARMALALYDHGPELLGQSWSATPQQQRRWYALSQLWNQTRRFEPDTEARD